MVMSSSYHPIGATAVSSAVIAVDCQKQVRSWSLLRSLIALLIPNCNCTSVHADDDHHHQDQSTLLHSSRSLMTTISSTTSVTGTLFGFRRRKACFCIQLPTTTSRPSSPITSTTPILLLELALPTKVLAKEMQTGVLRIALESYGGVSSSSSSSPDKLLSVPVWSMYCNGKKVGYAVKRRPREWEMDALRAMESVVGTGAAGAGIISAGRKDTGKEEDDEIMFLRANFERVKADDAESFHLIEPDQGSRINMGQELSIFFFRSK